MAKEEKEKKTKRKMAGEIASGEPTVQDEVAKGSKKRKKTKGKLPGGGGGSDRISELPNDILRAILSFLPLHCAVRTSILSRRWRHVWDPASVSSLDLDRSGFKRHRGFVEFVEKALSLSRETSQDVPRFFLSLPRAVPDPRWLQHALTHNVRVLELEVFSLGSSIVSNIFSCRSLEVLVLSFSDHWSELTPDDKDPVDLARLRTLRFTNGTFYSRFTERLDSHCPALKDLHFSRCLTSHLKISSPSLERLSLPPEESDVIHFTRCL